jgi:hypothetical protein
MSAKRIAIGLFSMCLATSAVVSAADDGSAIVSELRGSATVREDGKPERVVQLYDWVAERATLSVAKRSRVVLVLATGERFELAENARVTILRSGLPISPTVRMLPAVSPIPVVPPIASSTEGGSGTNAMPRAVSAAVRIRGSSFGNLYPSGNTTIADQTTLRFDGPKAASTFRITVNDEKGTPIFDAKTGEGHVVVPPGVLQADRTYAWSVTVADDSVSAEAEATFQTLPASTVDARGSFVASLRNDSVRDLALLARIDERLGLLNEARDELSAAAKQAPDDRQLRRMLARLNERLAKPTVNARP